jgi:hypothetical protein
MSIYISNTPPSTVFLHVYIPLFTILQCRLLTCLSVAPDNECKKAETWGVE